MVLAAALLALAPLPAPAHIRQPAAHLVSKSHLFALPDGAVGYVPASAGPNPPLLVLLHGAGHRQVEMVQHFEAEADARGIVLLAPDSHGITWDAVSAAEGPPDVDSPLAAKLAHRFGRSRDSERVEKAIADLARVVPIDRTRTVLAGFSDGATFAIAMGLSRAYRFAAVIAWSPGIAIRSEDPARGRRVFVSHGTHDPMLRFDVTCADIVPLLKKRRRGGHLPAVRRRPRRAPGGEGRVSRRGVRCGAGPECAPAADAAPDLPASRAPAPRCRDAAMTQASCSGCPTAWSSRATRWW